MMKKTLNKTFLIFFSITIIMSYVGSGGSLTAETDYLGIATFDGFTLDTAGNATLSITSADFVDTTHNILVQAGVGYHIFEFEDTNFQSIDVDDYDRGNDYLEGDGYTCTTCENNTLAYCKSLDEGGYTDW